jgi:hypothetical protein
MNNTEFYQKFVNVDFDKLLLDNNNELIQSETKYLKHKKDYLNTAQENFILYKKYNDELVKLTDEQYTVKNNKYTYIYVDEEKVNGLKLSLNKILKEQTENFENFKHYLEMLNKDKDRYRIKEKLPKKKNFLSKLLETSRNSTMVRSNTIGTFRRRSFDLK